jgi:uncharacterized protein with HEPN domain
MTTNRLHDYLDHMRQAIADAQSFTEGLVQQDFKVPNFVGQLPMQFVTEVK